MKIIRKDPDLSIELSRRNLLGLLAKLDLKASGEMDSKCTICQIDFDGEGRAYYVNVRAVEDAEHYSEREPGEMEEQTEVVLAASKRKDAS